MNKCIHLPSGGNVYIAQPESGGEADFRLRMGSWIKTDSFSAIPPGESLVLCKPGDSLRGEIAYFHAKGSRRQPISSPPEKIQAF